MGVLVLGAVFGLEVGVVLGAASSFLGARAEVGLDPLDECEAEAGRGRDAGADVFTGTPDLVGEVGVFREALGGDLSVGDLVVGDFLTLAVVASAGVCSGCADVG